MQKNLAISLAAIGLITALFLSSCEKPEVETQAPTTADSRQPAPPGYPDDSPTPHVVSSDQGPAAARSSNAALPSPESLTRSERSLISGDSLAVDAVERVLRSDDFDQFSHDFEAQTSSDVEAFALTALYRKKLSPLATGSGIQIQSLACGTTLCLMTLRSERPDAYEKWTSALDASKDVPFYSVMDTTLTDASRGSVHRVVMSIDPKANSVKALNTPQGQLRAP